MRSLKEITKAISKTLRQMLWFDDRIFPPSNEYSKKKRYIHYE